MRRKKKIDDGLDAKQRRLLAKLKGSFPIKDCRGVANYLSLLMEGQINGVIGKEILNGGVYAGAILMQAIKLAKDEIDVSETLPDSMKAGSIEMGTNRQELIGILTASTMAVQVKLLKQKEQEGKIINVEVQEVKEEVIEAQKPPIGERIAGLIKMAQSEEESLFAEE